MNVWLVLFFMALTVLTCAALVGHLRLLERRMAGLERLALERAKTEKRAMLLKFGEGMDELAASGGAGGAGGDWKVIGPPLRIPGAAFSDEEPR